MADQSRLEIVIDSRGAERNVRRVRGELSQMERAGTTALGSLRSAALLATGALAAIGVTAGLGNSIREIAAFQQAINGLAAVSGASAEQMGALESQARTLGATSQFSAQQAAEGQRFLAQAGFEVNEILGSTPGILQLATAAQLDLAAAADIASNVLGGMGLEVAELGRVNDVLAATASRSNTNIQQLGQALSFAAPFARSAGISIEEAAAAIGVMSDSGIQASRAGTGLVGFIRQLSNVTPAAEEALNSVGLSMDQVNVEALGLQTVIDNLRGANLNTAQAIKIFGSEAGAASQVLVNDYAGAVSDAEGEAARMASTLEQGLIPAFRSFGSAVSESALQLGDGGLAGSLESAVRGATGVISVWNGMGAEFRDANGVTEDYMRNIEGAANAVELLAVAVGARLTTALGSAASAQVAKTAASIANARAEAAAAQQVTRRTGAELASAKAMLSSIRLEEQATRGTAAHAFALNSLSAARTRAVAAAGAHTAATNAATVAMGRASVAARGLSGAMALVGGPAGVALLAAAGLFAFREELGLVPNPADRAREALDLLSESITDVNDASLDGAMIQLNAQMFELERQAREAREQLDRINSQSGGAGVLGFEGGQTGARARAEGELGGITAQQVVVQQEIERLQAMREGIDNAGAAGDSTADALGRLGTAADDLAAKFKPMLDDDVQDILDRAGPGARIDESGRLRDAFGNFLPSMQRDLESTLRDQFRAFTSEQNLMAGLERAAEAIGAGVADAIASSPAGLMATNSQDSAPGLAKPPSLGTMVFKLEGKDGQGGEVTVEGRADDLRRMADVFSGVASAS